MPLLTKHSPFLLVFAVVAVAGFSVQAADRDVERGKYLVTVMSCTDCHTPGALLGKPDTKRYLSGSEVGLALPDLGVFYAANLTPDKATGLGNWTIDEIASAIRTGKRADGHKLAPIMPVSSYRHLTPADALAIAAYLKTLPPVRNKVLGPFGPREKPVSFVMTVLPAETYWSLPRDPPARK